MGRRTFYSLCQGPVLVILCDFFKNLQQCNQVTQDKIHLSCKFSLLQSHLWLNSLHILFSSQEEQLDRRKEKAGSLCTSLMWDFVASNLDVLMTQLFDSSPILDSNNLHLHDSGKKKVLAEIVRHAAVKLQRKMYILNILAE